MRFQLILGKADREAYGDGLVLDKDKLDEDTACEDLIAWEEEADYPLHVLWLMSDRQPARWKRAVVWFALKQSGSDIAFADLKLRAVGAMRIKRIDSGDADPPDQTSSAAASAAAS